PHESPTVMTAPLILLAILSVIGGWVGLPGGANLFGRWVVFGHETPPEFNAGIALLSVGVAAAGFALGWAMFAMGKFRYSITSSPFAWFYRMLQRKYYLDDLYMGAIVRPVRDQLSRFAYWTNQNVLDGIVNGAGVLTVAVGNRAYRNLDQPVIDGFVNGLATLTNASGGRLKFWQAGNVQNSAAGLFLGLGVLVAVFILFRM
ncbi:MAG: hypothetical protein ACRDIU_09980, partial [Actinomycetota bacterium]